MRRALLLLVLLLLAAPARADPVLLRPSAGEGTALWSFSNPGNYTLVDVDLTRDGASLRWTRAVDADTAQADFAGGLGQVNVDLTSAPGDLLLANTSQPGPVRNATLQPPPADLADNYLYRGSGGATNFGGSTDLRVGNAGTGDLNRAILRFPFLPLPSNASIIAASLQLYLHGAQGGPMDIGAYRITSSWTEFGSTWNTRDGSNPWNTTGGDFDPVPLDLIPGVGGTAGWYTWNITSLVLDWWSGARPNDGVMVRQADDANVVGRRDFYSSDAANGSLRPRLLLNYTTPSSLGTLESRVLDGGSTTRWEAIWWNATVPPNASLDLETRAGNTPTPDGTWSPWSPPYALPGAPIASPPSRYLQYRARLFTPSAASPVLHDVAVVHGRYPARGEVVTEPLLPPGIAAWGRLAVDWAGPWGTGIAVAYSQDGGTSWTPAAPGGNLTGAPPRPLALRLTLVTGNTTESPRVRGLSLTFHLPPPAAGPPWFLWAPLPALGLIPLLLRRRLPRVEEVFVVYRDGLLIAHRSRSETSDKGDEALMGMLTAIQAFIRDAFSKGRERELEAMKIGDRALEIARGRFLYLAVIYSGRRTPALPRAMARLVAHLEGEYGEYLEAWNGVVGPLADVGDRVRVLFRPWG